MKTYQNALTAIRDGYRQNAPTVVAWVPNASCWILYCPVTKATFPTLEPAPSCAPQILLTGHKKAAPVPMDQNGAEIVAAWLKALDTGNVAAIEQVPADAN